MLKEKFEKKGGSTAIIVQPIDDYSKKIANEFADNLEMKNNPTSILFVLLALYSKQSEKVYTALKKEQIVIADRWEETFYAYNNYFGPLSIKPKLFREMITDLAFGENEPDITILLDIPPEMAHKKYHDRGREKLFHIKGSEETNTLEGFKHIHEHYLKITKQKENWFIVDGTKTIQQVHKSILELINNNFVEPFS